MKRRVTLFAGILLAIILILSIVVITQIKSNADDAKERKAKEEKFQKQQDEEIALKEQLNNLNNKDYIEKIARDDYYLSNDGEVIFKLPKDKNNCAKCLYLGKMKYLGELADIALLNCDNKHIIELN